MGKIKQAVAALAAALLLTLGVAAPAEAGMKSTTRVGGSHCC